uniref:Uncharacterized protein n=1 Tax=Hyaloperonospora arabidopsidis (strain Emoy2) TaxID=559515 RepID=M4C480_HYAAE
MNLYLPLPIFWAYAIKVCFQRPADVAQLSLSSRNCYDGLMNHERQSYTVPHCCERRRALFAIIYRLPRDLGSHVSATAPSRAFVRACSEPVLHHMEYVHDSAELQLDGTEDSSGQWFQGRPTTKIEVAPRARGAAPRR